MINFSIDTLPLTDKIINSNDYSSKIVYSAISDSLFKYNKKLNKIVKNSCYNYKYSKNNKLLTIKIRKDLFSYNGERILAYHYYNLFKNILKKNTHIGIIFKRFFKDVKIIDDFTLQLVNTVRNNKSYEILSIYSTGCFKYSSGPYYIKKRTNVYILLERNKFYRKKISNIEAKQIKFILTDGINDYKLFKKNKIHITNNTLCDVNNVDKYNYIAESNFIYLNISFAPIFMNKKYKKIRKIICQIIDKQKISNLLNNKFDINNSFVLNTYMKNQKKWKNTNPFADHLLKLGYNNFYPNKIIATEIKRQLENNGFKICLVENDFNLKNNCDLNISLNYLEYISESSLINGTYLSIMLNKSFIYKKILKVYNILHQKEILKIIDDKLLRENYKIPLLQMKGYYLKKDKYREFNYIELNYDEL